MGAKKIVLNKPSFSFTQDKNLTSDSNSPTWMINVLPMQMERRESMETGSRIKYHRLKKRMSIEELATEILPVRELKKIEAGVKSPSLKDLQALCKKLEIPLAPKDNPIGKVLVKNFKTSLLHPQNKGKIMEQYADIHDHPLLHVDEDIELEYCIQQIRYFIITGDLDSAEEKIREMDRFKEFMDQEQFYLFHKYNGNYNYILNDFEEALKIYLIAEKIAPPSLSPSEIGDLYYSIGITATQCWETSMASKYSEMALKIYQQEFIPKRLVECHLNIAISDRRLGNFQKAKEHFKHALTIGAKLDIDILKFTTEYNYGYFYYHFQDYDLAIQHLNNALKFIPAEYTSDILLNYCVLLKCHIELKDFKAAKKLLIKGHNLILEKNLSLDMPSNHIFKEAYTEFICLSHLINEEIAQFEEYFLEKLIPILSQNYKDFELGFYYGTLGNIYFEQGEFEKSAIMLNKAQQSYKNLMIIK